MDSTRRFSFGANAAAYHHLRPPVPQQAVDWLIPAPCNTAIDLGAGTGLFTRDLLTRAAKVYAVEPNEQMHGILHATCPQAVVMNGDAEHIPLQDDSADAVFACGAWHWFDPERAVPEITRVLRPGGRLAVVWNQRDNDIDWMANLDRLIEQPGEPDREPGECVLLLPEHTPFTNPQRYVRTWTRAMTPGDLVRLLATYSGVATMNPTDRAAVLEVARIYINNHPDLAGRNLINVPFRTVGWRTDLGN